MVSRLMLSLKKASRDKKSGWTSDALSRAHIPTGTRMEFGLPSNCVEDSIVTTFDEAALSDLGHSQAGEKNVEEKV